jgi:hypothetical protein
VKKAQRLIQQMDRRLGKVAAVKSYDRPYCVDKMSYTKAHARTAAAEMTKGHGFVLQPYKCSVCGRWHVGRRGW